MLILTRQIDEGITINLTEETLEELLAAVRETGEDQRIHILVTRRAGNNIGLGVTAPKSVEINRDEIQEQIDAETEEIKNDQSS